jgi:polyhydroxyalkanoate synthase
VPGTLLNVFSSSAAPDSFIWSRWVDALASAADSDALRTHLLVTRWSLDEAPLAGRLFEEVVEYLYRENRFTGGNLMIDGRRVRPGEVVAPMINVVDRQCRVVPPEAVLPFHRAAGSTEKQLLWYRGDAGVALRHVGPLVGENAHRELWPRIMRWIHGQHRGAPQAGDSAKTDR